VFQALQFAAGITLPIFIVLFMGTLLKRLGQLDDAFIATASRLSFNVALPALLFLSIVRADIDLARNMALVFYGLISTTVVYILLELIIPKLLRHKPDIGVVIQGSFRSNMGIVGLAYCINAYGDAAYATASVYLAVVTILFNILAVITLTRWQNEKQSARGLLTTISASLTKNPLIIAIVSALVINQIGLPLPDTVLQAGNYFAQLALPLALLCAGASLNFKSGRDAHPAILATVLRLAIIPFAISAVGVLVGFRGMDLGVLFLMASAPTAAASYVMARAMGGNATLAANIIAMTTIISLVTTGLGAALLRGLGLT
jgi:predicted permease